MEPKSGITFLHPEMHPLTKDVIDNMRVIAEQDTYHGCTWETITVLCDEVEFLQKKLKEQNGR